MVGRRLRSFMVILTSIMAHNGDDDDGDSMIKLLTRSVWGARIELRRLMDVGVENLFHRS